MSYVVQMWRMGFRGGAMEYEDETIGPFRDEGRAHDYAGRLERALAKRGLDEWTVEVAFVWPSSESAREMADTVARREAT